MNKIFKKTMFQSAIGLVLIFSCTTISHSLLVQNWRECINAPGCTCEATTATLSTLKPYITDSAGNFLNSHSAYQTFLNRIELAEINGISAVEMKAIIYNVIDNMERAKVAYAGFKLASEKTSYNQEMIDQLLKFDYDGFRIKYGLVEPIFEKLKIFLSKGDIAGFDNAVLVNMDIILNQLYKVNAALDKDQLPDIQLLWRINQTYAEAQLFGQYMSEIFKDILGK